MDSPFVFWCASISDHLCQLDDAGQALLRTQVRPRGDLKIKSAGVTLKN